MRDDDLRDVGAGYDRWSAVYDHDGNPLIALEEPEMRKLIGPVAGCRVLDLGCGTGRHSLWLAAGGAVVTGVDFSEGMLEKARRKPGSELVSYISHDLHHGLPFGSASFDRVVSGLVLEHIGDLAAFFHEAYRVLVPGGFAVMSSMHPAMMLRGTQAQFHDPDSGEVVRPGSLPHQVSDFVMAALAAGFELEYLGEHLADAELAARYPRAEKYIGWPMLMILRIRKEEEQLYRNTAP